VLPSAASIKPSSALFTKLTVNDREADATSVLPLSGLSFQKNEIAMLTAIETSLKNIPNPIGPTTLMAAGNCGCSAPQRPLAPATALLDSFRQEEHNAEWRIAWLAYLEHQPYMAIRSPFSSAVSHLAALTTLSTGWAATPAQRQSPTRAFYRKASDVSPPGTDGTLPCASALAGEEKISDVLAQIPQRLCCVPSTSRSAPALPIAGIAQLSARWLRRFRRTRTQSPFATTNSPIGRSRATAFDQGHFAAGMNYGPSFQFRSASSTKSP
jgi:hypothetical protein